MARLITDRQSTALRAKLFHTAASTPAKHADSCGCVTGTRFLGVTLVLSTACYTWLWAAAELSIWAALLHILVWSFLGALFGKTVGIVNYRLRHRATSPMAGNPPRARKARSRPGGYR